MRAVLTRVKSASVTVDGSVIGQIGQGFLILLGVTHEDTEAQAVKLADKLMGLRIFEDENGKMNRSLEDVGGQVLVVSQCTLYGNCKKGRRPEFLGKPRPAMVQLALAETGFPPEQAVLIGDRLYTDIACAVNAGIDSIFVLSGEGKREDIERDSIHPTWVYDDIGAVLRAWEETP